MIVKLLLVFETKIGFYQQGIVEGVTIKFFVMAWISESKATWSSTLYTQIMPRT